LTSQNVEFVEKRNKEIREVLKSIEDINEIFRDVAALVSNQVRKRDIQTQTIVMFDNTRTYCLFQGTILDQIEYNIEKTVVQLEQGNKHLAKAVEHKQRGLKFKLILIAVGLSVLLFIFLVAFITR
jgi:syntaxin 16